MTIEWRKLMASFLCAAAILAVLTALVGDRIEGQQRERRPDREWRALVQWGVPDQNYLRPADQYLIGAPDRTRCPRWTLERLTPESVKGDSNRRDDEWFADRRVPKEWRVQDSAYAKSGYDRGHLAASANHESQESLQAATFLLSNTMPQFPELNRGPWNQLEKQIRERVKAGEVAWVITVPMWVKDEQGNICARTIGNGLWAPTHCGKAVLWAPSERQSGDAQTLKLDCWILPNEEGVADDIGQYRVSGDAFEAAAGLDIFAGVPDDIETKLEDEK